MTGTIAGAPPLASRAHRRMPQFPSGEPVPTAWREDVLTRAEELDSLRAWLLEAPTADAADPWWTAIREHLDAVKQAAEGPPRPPGPRRPGMPQRVVGHRSRRPSAPRPASAPGRPRPRPRWWRPGRWVEEM
jgi:hypothetical protein